MKQYEIRTKDLSEVRMALPDGISLRNAKLKLAVENRSVPDDCVWVLHTFETKSEADAARLDWIEDNHPDIIKEAEELWYIECSKGRFHGTTIRRALDLARQAPQPTVRVIATPESVGATGSHETHLHTRHDARQSH